jgi:hypothetical protein
MRFVIGRWVVIGGVVTAVYALACLYAALMPAASAAYRLLAERAGRKTLVALVTCVPTGMIAVMERGLGGPAIRVRVGDAARIRTLEAWRGR